MCIHSEVMLLASAACLYMRNLEKVKEGMGKGIYRGQHPYEDVELDDFIAYYFPSFPLTPPFELM